MRIPLDDDSMKDLFDKIRDGSPSEFFGLGQTARNIEKLILTERAILDTFKDTRSYIDRAVDVLARGTPQEAQELQNAVFTLLEARSLEITEEATEELPSSVRMVARKALGF